MSAGCNRHQTSGQTVATVNGEDITTSDLQLELADVPADQRGRLQAQALKAIVERKLFAQYGKNQGIERSPNYVLQLRRAGETLLAQRAAQQIAAQAQQPITGDAANDYLNAHPDLSANRRILLVDQLLFATPAAAVLAELKPVMSIGDLSAVLQRHGIPSQRAQTQVDTATLPNDVIAKIDHAKPGEPMITIQGDRSLASAVSASKPAPLEGDAADQLARRRMDSERSSAALRQRADALRQGAQITYAKGYAPAGNAGPAKGKVLAER